MNKATLTKLWALEGLRGMTYDDMSSVIEQVLDKPDCGNIVFLDVGQVYSAVDLQDKHAKVLLYQKISAS